MSLYNISFFKTKLGYFTLETYDQYIISLYPSKNKKIKIENKSDIHENFYINLNKYFSKKVISFKYKVKQEGTLFQKLVWKEIAKIQYGQTSTYNKIAKNINSAPRAIGNACSKNKCLFIVPCHRVICSNGNIGDYVLGNKIKKYLLDMEKNG